MACSNLSAMTPGTWCQADNSILMDSPVKWTEIPRLPPSDAPARLMSESGAAFDPTRNRLYHWGGGHGSSADNSIIAFDVPSQAWVRITDPSVPVTAQCVDPHTPFYADGRARAWHSYSSLIYCPERDALIKFAHFGGWAIGSDGQDVAHAYRLALGTFQILTTPNMVGNSGASSMAARHPTTGNVYAKSAGADITRPMTRWNQAADTWTQLAASDFTHSNPGKMNCAIDPVRNHFWAIGTSRANAGAIDGPTFVHRYDLNAGSVIAVPMTLTATNAGALDILLERAPGFEWISPAFGFLLWSPRYGADVFKFDPVALTITRIAPHASNTVVPYAVNSLNKTGVYRKFSWIASLGVAVVTMDARESVYFYKAVL